MNSMAGIEPGTAVHSTDGPAGTVEGHAAPLREGETAEGVLLVRSHDGARSYRVPATLIQSISTQDGRPVVRLNASSAMLQGYVSEVRPAADIATSSRPASEEWAPGSEEAELRIPLVAEELAVHTQPISLGRVHVHKGVETVEQQLTIPIFREEAIVERIAPEDYDVTAAVGPDELIIPVVEEKIVFEKRAVVKEYIRIRKQRVQEDQDVRGTVRREYVEVTEQPREGQDSSAPSLFKVQ
jgi:uncharacterized protein (TIGR02271 family)